MCVYAIYDMPSSTLLVTNISFQKGTFEDDFPVLQVGYVSSLEGIYLGLLELFIIHLAHLEGERPYLGDLLTMGINHWN